MTLFDAFLYLIGSLVTFSLILCFNMFTVVYVPFKLKWFKSKKQRVIYRYNYNPKFQSNPIEKWQLSYGSGEIDWTWFIPFRGLFEIETYSLVGFREGYTFHDVQGLNIAKEFENAMKASNLLKIREKEEIARRQAIVDEINAEFNKNHKTTLTDY